MSNIDSRLGRELGSFYALIVMNIVVGAVIMGLSISGGVQTILAFVNSLPAIESLYSLPLAAIVLAVAGVAMWWLITSAELFSEAQEVREDFARKDSDNGTGTTSIIVKTMALYRERKNTIARMAWVSRLTGIFLIGVGLYSLAGLAIFGISGNVIETGISIALNFGMGVVALYIPHLFSNFSRSWDGRLTKGEEAERELRRVLEGEA